MGEIQRHHVTHHLSPELRDILKVMATPTQLLLSATAEPGTEATSPEPVTPPVERWTFYDPRQQRDVVAFLDPDNQVRHIGVNIADAAPKTWRRIFIEVSQ